MNDQEVKAAKKEAQEGSSPEDFKLHYDPQTTHPVLVTRITGGMLANTQLFHLLFFSGTQIPFDLEGKDKRVVANLVASILLTPDQARFLKESLEEFLKDVGEAQSS